MRNNHNHGQKRNRSPHEEGMTKGTAVGMGMVTVLVMATVLVEEHLPIKEVFNRDIFLHPSTRLPLRLQRLRASSRIPLH
jgi:hypothetical protein